MQHHRVEFGAEPIADWLSASCTCIHRTLHPKFRARECRDASGRRPSRKLVPRQETFALSRDVAHGKWADRLVLGPRA